MSATIKHWGDILIAVIAVIATYATPIVTFITGVLGTIWYGIRIYEWWKGRYANVRND